MTAPKHTPERMSFNMAAAGVAQAAINLDSGLTIEPGSHCHKAMHDLCSYLTQEVDALRDTVETSLKFLEESSDRLPFHRRLQIRRALRAALTALEES